MQFYWIGRIPGDLRVGLYGLNVGMKILKKNHAYAKGRKSINTIWSLEDDRGRRHESFDGMARTWVEHFQNLFRSPEGVSIVEIMRIA